MHITQSERSTPSVFYYSSLQRDIPLHDALVGADDGGLDVDGMVSHSPQLHGLLQSSHHEQSVVPLCAHKDRQRERERPCWCRCSRRRGNVEVGERRLTSVGVGELGAAEEAQVARPGPGSLGVSKTESGVEVVGLENLLAVTAVVTAAVMSAVHPDLQESPDNLLFSIYRVEITNPLHVQIPK